MSIHQTKKTSDLEKRLKLLRQQVHGREFKIQDKFASSKQPATGKLSDLTYLRQDLLKITIFSTLAIGSQIILYFLIKNSVINLKFF